MWPLALVGAVVANDLLAVNAGMRVLQEGGNAFDAAVAVGAAINVVEPDNSHLGGHALIMLYHAASGKVMAINGTGPAPRKAKLEDFVPRRACHSAGWRRSWCREKSMPMY